MEPRLFRSSGQLCGAPEAAALPGRGQQRGRVPSARLAGAGLIEARQTRQVDGAPLRLASGDKTIPGWLFPPLHPHSSSLADRPTAEPAHSPRKSRFKAVPGIDLTANLQRRFACGRALIRPAFLFRPLSFRRNPSPIPCRRRPPFSRSPTKQ